MASWLSTYKSKRKSRKRKANKAKMAKHLEKHPKYYNQDNPILWRSFCLVFTFYMLLILINSED